RVRERPGPSSPRRRHAPIPAPPGDRDALRPGAARPEPARRQAPTRSRAERRARARATRDRLLLPAAPPEAVPGGAALHRERGDRPHHGPDVGDPPRDEHPDPGSWGDTSVRDSEQRSEAAVRRTPGGLDPP